MLGGKNCFTTKFNIKFLLLYIYMNNTKLKYLKYKRKYLKLKKQTGGASLVPNSDDVFKQMKTTVNKREDETIADYSTRWPTELNDILESHPSLIDDIKKNKLYNMSTVKAMKNNDRDAIRIINHILNYSEYLRKDNDNCPFCQESLEASENEKKQLERERLGYVKEKTKEAKKYAQVQLRLMMASNDARNIANPMEWMKKKEKEKLEELLNLGKLSSQGETKVDAVDEIKALVIIPECGHKMHYNCFEDFKKERQERHVDFGIQPLLCPICRVEFNEEAVQKTYPEKTMIRLGNSFVGRHIIVKFDDNRWYPGTIETFDDSNMTHIVNFLNGDTGKYPNSELTFMLLKVKGQNGPVDMSSVSRFDDTKVYFDDEDHVLWMSKKGRGLPKIDFGEKFSDTKNKKARALYGRWVYKQEWELVGQIIGRVPTAPNIREPNYTYYGPWIFHVKLTNGTYDTIKTAVSIESENSSYYRNEYFIIKSNSDDTKWELSTEDYVNRHPEIFTFSPPTIPKTTTKVDQDNPETWTIGHQVKNKWTNKTGKVIKTPAKGDTMVKVQTEDGIYFFPILSINMKGGGAKYLKYKKKYCKYKKKYLQLKFYIEQNSKGMNLL